MKKGFITPKEAVLSFQHVFAMLGATILVPILANMSISIALISAGIGTIIFYFITKRKVPVFLGSSFAFLSALCAQMGDKGAIGSETWNYAMAQLSIAVLCTGLVYVILSLIIKLVGTNFIRKLFPPIVVGPVIIVIGMCLAPVAINNFVAPAGATSTQTIGYVIAGIATAATIIGFSVFAKGFFKIIPVLLGIVVGYIVALCFGIVNFDTVINSGWILFQPSEFTKAFGWYGSLGKIWNKDLVAVILMFAPIAIVTFMEHLGDVNASSIVCGKDFITDPGVHRTLLGVGGPCNTTYGENTAVLSLTKNYNPNVLFVAGIFAVVLGIFSKFGAVLGTIPAPVIGGASLILYGMIAANGLKTIVEAKVDFSDSKNMIICSVILVIGIGMSAAGKTLNIGILSFSALAVATFIGIILNAIFMIGRGKNKQESIVGSAYGGELVKSEEATEENAVVEETTEEAVVEETVATESTDNN